MTITYAIGDVHGHANEFKQLLELIKQDMATHPVGTNFRVIQMGDIIDHGPDSKTVIELCMTLEQIFPNTETHVLMGKS